MKKYMALGLLVCGLFMVGCGENSPTNVSSPSSVEVVERDIKVTTKVELIIEVRDSINNLPVVGALVTEQDWRDSQGRHLYQAHTDVNGQVRFEFPTDSRGRFDFKHPTAGGCSLPIHTERWGKTVHVKLGLCG